MRILALLLLAALAGGWFATGARGPDTDAVAGLSGDPDAGERVFWAAGCASCHAGEEAEGEDRLVLAGGQRLATEFGVFAVPNVSPDREHGIGGWSLADFAGALRRGVSPDGAHYYPAFPYTAYARMEMQDIADLKAFMDTLPASDRPNDDHALSFPFSIRRGVAVWKWLNVSEDWVVQGLEGAAERRGRYLAEALGHCGECHTPRNAFGGLDHARWLAGAPNPTGDGRIPDITPAGLDWSEGDIAYYLETGFTPDYDSAGGHMARVVRSLAELPASDREALAAYLKALPPVESPEG